MAARIIEQLRLRTPGLRSLQQRVLRLQQRLADQQREIETLRQQQAKLQLQHQADIPADGFKAFLRNFRPMDVVGFAKRRLGGKSDGGYVVVDDFAGVRFALSFGIGDDDSWDCDVARMGIDVFQFDHEVQQAPSGGQRLHFHRLRVVDRGDAPDTVTLRRILGWPELACDRDVVAKIDIEGDEWPALAACDASILDRLRQFVVEFHDLDRFHDPVWRAQATAALQAIRTTHTCVHIHGNNATGFAVAGGIPFPRTLEATFVRTADYTLVPSTAIFPTDLDAPNLADRPDLFLGSWPF